jgi:hypothetical protein
MPGKTGKRAKGAAPCAACKQKIAGGFLRTQDGDFHELCWWKKYFPDSPHAKDRLGDSMTQVEIREWECWFQYNERGAGGFRKVFAATDADSAWDWAEEFSAKFKAMNQGDIFPVRDSLIPSRPLL